MQYFLAKTDPGTYSAGDLARDGRTIWDGVTNAQAVKCIRSMRPADRVFIYHSQGQPAIVALAKVTGEPRPDPKNEKSWVVELEFARSIEPPVPLAAIKESGLFNDWALIRQGRLSTMPVPASFVEWMQARHAWLKQ